MSNRRCANKCCQVVPYGCDEGTGKHFLEVTMDELKYDICYVFSNLPQSCNMSFLCCLCRNTASHCQLFNRCFVEMQEAECLYCAKYRLLKNSYKSVS